MKSDAWYPRRGSARGGEPSFTELCRNGEVAPIVVRGAAIEPLGSTRTIPSGSREQGGSPLRQAGQAQAGDVDFENFRCHMVSVLAKAGDGQFGVDGKHSTEFGACLVEPAEMGIGGNFDPHRRDQARLVVQG